jgi:hypothetical protein
VDFGGGGLIRESDFGGGGLIRERLLYFFKNVFIGFKKKLNIHWKYLK